MNIHESLRKMRLDSNDFRVKFDLLIIYEKEYIHKYLNFIQAQMSNEELALIFYDVISHYGLDKNFTHQFKDIIDEYGFLENIDAETLLDRRHHIIFHRTRFRFLNRDEKMQKTS